MERVVQVSWLLLVLLRHPTLYSSLFCRHRAAVAALERQIAETKRGAIWLITTVGLLSGDKELEDFLV